MSFEFKRIAVGALALTAAVVVGCGGSDDTTSDAGAPEDAVQAFFDASKAEDASAACATLTAESQDLAATGEDSCEAAFQKSIDAGTANVPDSIEIGDATTDGDTATVPVTGSGGEKTDFTVVQQDGTWKIDLTAGAATGGDSSAPSTDSTTG